MWAPWRRLRERDFAKINLNPAFLFPESRPPRVPFPPGFLVFRVCGFPDGSPGFAITEETLFRRSAKVFPEVNSGCGRDGSEWNKRPEARER
jgi:hypothetical protein